MERKELIDHGTAAILALAEPNGAHLRERPNWLPQALARENATRDKGRRDGPHSGK